MLRLKAALQAVAAAAGLSFWVGQGGRKRAKLFTLQIVLAFVEFKYKTLRWQKIITYSFLKTDYFFLDVSTEADESPV